jgi:hypothetical protein
MGRAVQWLRHLLPVRALSGGHGFVASAPGRLRRLALGRTRYHCGALVQPGPVLRDVLPAMLRPLAGVLAPVLGYLALRGIAVGTGCDCDLQVEPPAGGDAA